MPHIDVDKTLPGIRSLMAFRPETAEPLGALAEVSIARYCWIKSGRPRIDRYLCFLSERLFLLSSFTWRNSSLLSEW